MTIKRYIEDYEIEVSLDEKGHEKRTLRYRGPHFDISLTGLTYQVYKRISFLLFSGLSVFHISSGFAANQGMYQFYVALPYAIAFLPLFFLGLGLFELPKNHLKIQRDKMEQSFKRVKINITILFVLFTIEILGEVFFLVFNSVKKPLFSEYFFLFPELISILFVIGMFRLQKKIHIQISQE